MTELALRQACSYDGAGIRACLEAKHSASARDLQLAEKEFQSSVDQWDQEKPLLDISLQELFSANASFKQYRKDQCALASTLGGTAIGNALDVRQLACEAELNQRRAAQLRAFGADLP